MINTEVLECLVSYHLVLVRKLPLNRYCTASLLDTVRSYYYTVLLLFCEYVSQDSVASLSVTRKRKSDLELAVTVKEKSTALLQRTTSTYRSFLSVQEVQFCFRRAIGNTWENKILRQGHYNSPTIEKALQAQLKFLSIPLNTSLVELV